MGSQTFSPVLFYPSGDTTGATDTAALQAFFNGVTQNPGSAGSAQLAAGIFYLNASLTIPASAGWRFWGAGRYATALQMVPNNTPIFAFTTTNTGGWDVGHMTFEYANNQAFIANAAAAGTVFYFAGASAGSHDTWNVHDCYFLNCCRAFSTPTTSAPNVWGFTIEKCWFSSIMAGGVMWANAAPAGEPSCVFRDNYINAGTSGGINTSTPANDSVLTMADADILWEQCEINAGYGYSATTPQINLTSCSTVHMLHSRVEQSSFTGSIGSGLWFFTQCKVSLDSCEMNTMGCSGANGNLLYGSTYTTIEIKNLSANLATGSVPVSLVTSYYLQGLQNIEFLAGLLTVNAIVGGSGYTTGTYPNVALNATAGYLNGLATGALATITVAGGVVTAVSVTTPGTNYGVGQTLTGSFGGGSGFSCLGATVNLTVYPSGSPANAYKQFLDYQTIDVTTVNATTTGTVALTMFSSRVQLFTAARTGNITVDLPAVGYNDSAEFIFISKAAAQGAFTFTVTDPTSGNSETIAASTNGCMRWRASSAQRWDCTYTSGTYS